MKKLFLLTKNYARKQPISSLLVVVIWVICLVPIPDTPLSQVKMIDKWTHLVMYFVLVMTILVEYGVRKRKAEWRKMFVFALLLPISMSGAIELAQAYLTCGTRSGEWVDFLANAIGASVGFAIGSPLALYLATRGRGEQP